MTDAATQYVPLSLSLGTGGLAIRRDLKSMWDAVDAFLVYRCERKPHFSLRVLSCQECENNGKRVANISTQLCGAHRYIYWRENLAGPSHRRTIHSLPDLELERFRNRPDIKHKRRFSLERARRQHSALDPELRARLEQLPFHWWIAQPADLLPNALRTVIALEHLQNFNASRLQKAYKANARATKARGQGRPKQDLSKLEEAIQLMMNGTLGVDQYKKTLDGVSIRNLLLTVKASSKPHYFDDASILGRDNERRFDVISQRSKALKADLERSQSAVDLKAAAAASAIGNGSANGDIKRPPGVRRLSTLGWWHESGRARQQLLEDAMSNRIPNTFFTIHPKPGTDTLNGTPRNKLAFYVSETVRQSMNPDFRFFDASPREFNGAFVSLLQHFVLKVWVQPTSLGVEAADFFLLLEMDVSVSGLRKIANTIDGYPHPFPANSIIFHFSDGVYVSSLEIPVPPTSSPALSRSTSLALRNTSSFDELMKLSTTIECIDDALRTRLALAKDISNTLAEHRQSYEKTTSASNAPSTIKDHTDAVAETKRQTKKLQMQLNMSRQKINSRRSAIDEGQKDIDSAETTLHQHTETIQSLNTQIPDHKTHVIAQIRRVATTLLDIFPITPIPGAPLCFRVAGLYLPSASTFTYSQSPSRTPAAAPIPDDESTAAALGHACFLIQYLATQIGTAVPYPLNPRGSVSEVFDPLTPASQLGIHASISSNERRDSEEMKEAPTPQSAPHRVYILSHRVQGAGSRFPWAVYLLNKNLEELGHRCGIKIVDPRNTAANLKYVLEVLASGRGAVGGREAGNVAAFTSRVTKDDRERTING